MENRCCGKTQTSGPPQSEAYQPNRPRRNMPTHTCAPQGPDRRTTVCISRKERSSSIRENTSTSSVFTKRCTMAQGSGLGPLNKPTSQKKATLSVSPWRRCETFAVDRPSVPDTRTHTASLTRTRRSFSRLALRLEVTETPSGTYRAATAEAGGGGCISNALPLIAQDRDGRDQSGKADYMARATPRCAIQSSGMPNASDLRAIPEKSSDPTIFCMAWPASSGPFPRAMARLFGRCAASRPS